MSFTDEIAMRTFSMQDLFYDKMMADDRIYFFFKGVDMKRQRAHQVSHPAYMLFGMLSNAFPIYEGMHGCRKQSTSGKSFGEFRQIQRALPPISLCLWRAMCA